MGRLFSGPITDQGTTMKHILALALFALMSCGRPVAAEEIRVGTGAELNAAVRRAKPGDRILIKPGTYAGYFFFTNVHGQSGRPILIAGADPARPPEFTGGVQFSEITHTELRDLTVRGAKGNGFNIDHGGTPDTPSHHLTLRRLRVLDSGAGGNQDGIKLSGIDDFRVEECVIDGWSAGGSGIDMVGCHRGMFVDCRFRRGGDTGIQAKGGSSEITVRGCRFEDYGGRGLNLGGSTGMQFFSPPVASMPRNGKYEAKNITVEHCVFFGGMAPVAFVGVDGAVVRRNTIYRPGRWALRILQETRDAEFVPSRNGVFEDNIIVFRSNQWSEGGVNIGPGTAPQTFRFARNLWYCEDRPDRSRPTLPTPESTGIYGLDPQFRSPESGDFTLKPGSPGAGRGAH